MTASPEHPDHSAEPPHDPGAQAAASGTAAPRVDHREAWEALLDVFEQAADEPRISGPIGRIEHVVLLRSLDVDGSGALLVCRGGRLEVRDQGDSSERPTIELALRTPEIEKLAAGRLRTAMAIASGRATYGGPVRQFLRVLPLVQAMVNPPVAMGTNTEDELVEEIA